MPHPRTQEGGKGLRASTPLRWIPVGRDKVCGLGSGLRNRGSPRESLAQLGAESGQKATCSQDACAFSNIPTAALWGQLHPQSHTKPVGAELGGLLLQLAPEVNNRNRLKLNQPLPPAEHSSPHHTSIQVS